MYPYGNSEPTRRKPAPPHGNRNGHDQYRQIEAAQAESTRAPSRRVPQIRFPFHDDAEEHLRMPAKPVRDTERVQSDELIQPPESHPTYGAGIQAGSPLKQVQSKAYRDYKSLTETREMENFELMDPAYRLQHEDQVQKARSTEEFDLMDPAHRLKQEDRPKKLRGTEDFNLADSAGRHYLSREAEQSRQQREQVNSKVRAAPYIPQELPQTLPRVSSSQRTSRNGHHHRQPDLQYRGPGPAQDHAVSYAPTGHRYSPRPSRDSQYHQQPKPHYCQGYPHQDPETRPRKSSTRHTTRRQASGTEELLALDSTSHWIRNPSARNGRYPPQPILQEKRPAIRYSPPRREVRAAPVVPFEVNPTPQQIDEMERQRRPAKMQSEERRVRVGKKWQQQEHEDHTPPKKSRWDLQPGAKELRDQQELGGKHGDWWIDQYKERRHPMQSSPSRQPKKRFQIRSPSPEFRYLPSEPLQRKPLSPELQLETPKTKLKRRGFGASLQEKVLAAATKLKKTISRSTEPPPHPTPEPRAGPDTSSSDSSSSSRPFSFSTSVGIENFTTY